MFVAVTLGIGERIGVDVQAGVIVFFATDIVTVGIRVFSTKGLVWVAFM